MEKKPSVAFEKLLQAVALGNTEEDVLTSIAGRLARMEHRITKEDEQAISKASGGLHAQGPEPTASSRRSIQIGT